MEEMMVEEILFLLALAFDEEGEFSFERVSLFEEFRFFFFFVDERVFEMRAVDLASSSFIP